MVINRDADRFKLSSELRLMRFLALIFLALLFSCGKKEKQIAQTTSNFQQLQYLDSVDLGSYYFDKLLIGSKEAFTDNKISRLVITGNGCHPRPFSINENGLIIGYSRPNGAHKSTYDTQERLLKEEFLPNGGFPVSVCEHYYAGNRLKMSVSYILNSDSTITDKEIIADSAQLSKMRPDIPFKSRNAMFYKFDEQNHQLIKKGEAPLGICKKDSEVGYMVYRLSATGLIKGLDVFNNDGVLYIRLSMNTKKGTSQLIF